MKHYLGLTRCIHIQRERVGLTWFNKIIKLTVDNSAPIVYRQVISLDVCLYTKKACVYFYGGRSGIPWQTYFVFLIRKDTSQSVTVKEHSKFRILSTSATKPGVLFSIVILIPVLLAARYIYYMRNYKRCCIYAYDNSINDLPINVYNILFEFGFLLFDNFRR